MTFDFRRHVGMKQRTASVLGNIFFVFVVSVACELKVAINKMLFPVVSVVQDRIDSISYNKLYWEVACEASI